MGDYREEQISDGIAQVCTDSSNSDEDPDFFPWVPSYLTSSDEEEEISDNEVEILKAGLLWRVISVMSCEMMSVIL